MRSSQKKRQISRPIELIEFANSSEPTGRGTHVEIGPKRIDSGKKKN